MSIRKSWMGKGSLVALCALMSVSLASADLPEIMFELTADAGPISVTIPIPSAWGTYDPETQIWSWTLENDLPFEANGQVVATLTQFDVMVREDPEVNLNFAVQAGAGDTTFSIASALLTFAPISNAQGIASAAMTITDQNGDGAMLTGIGATGGAYLAQYNGWAGDPINGPSGTTFHEGITNIMADPWMQGTASTGQGWTAISDTVNDMSALISFSLTGQDLASGTSHYEIVPEPAAGMLLIVAGLFAARRRS